MPRIAWGKFHDGAYHHLAHHSADVAACFETLTKSPAVRARMECAAKGNLSPRIMARLAVIAFLHDAGKLNPGFQSKGWPKGLWTEAARGHVTEGAAIFGAHGPAEIAQNLCLDALIAWGVEFDLLYASLAHHGRPFKTGTVSAQLWRRFGDYDPVESSGRIGSMIPLWFPDAFAGTHESLPSTPDFQHLFCGLAHCPHRSLPSLRPAPRRLCGRAHLFRPIAAAKGSSWTALIFNHRPTPMQQS